MKKKPIVVPALVLTLTLLVTVLPTSGHHDMRMDDRIVQPYNSPVLFHVPILAGYEPLPPPQHCLPATSEGLGVHYHEDFTGDHGWDIIQTPLSTQGINLWHVTDWSGPGTDEGRTTPERLYFGLAEGSGLGIPGTFHIQNDEDRHVAGTAQSPPIQLPDAPGLALVFDTKWAVEWLKGYDHMWVELLDESGQVHLLCSNNSLDRLEATSGGNEHRVGSCSPILIGPCPTGEPFSEEGEPNEFPVDGLPAWETRMVQIPDQMAGQEIRLRFTFDTADGVANQFMGWMVDDVRIVQSGLLPP